MKNDLNSQSRRNVGLIVWAASYCGNISKHLYGNLLLATLGGLLPQIFVATIPFTLLEQSFFSIVAFAIGASLVRLKLRQTTYLG